MREILFKAKRKDNGEWVEGYLFDNGMFEGKRYFVGGLVIELYTGTACDDWNITGIDFYEIDPDTICQYTGLTDKNGRKIWENDIVTCKKRIEGYDRYKVVWREEFADFGVEPLKYKVQYPICFTIGRTLYGRDYNVDSNIFDNSELLGGVI